jgi:hypothetical protein
MKLPLFTDKGAERKHPEKDFEAFKSDYFLLRTVLRVYYNNSSAY